VKKNFPINLKRTFYFFRFFTKQELLTYFTVLFLKVAFSLLDLIGIFILGALITILTGGASAGTTLLRLAILGLDEQGVSNSYTLLLAIGAGFFVVKGMLSNYLNFFAAKALGKIELRLKTMIFEKLNYTNLTSFVGYTRSSVAQALTTSAYASISKLSLALLISISETALIIFIATYLAFTHFGLLLILFSYVLLVAISMYFFINRKSQKLAKYAHDSILSVKEIIFSFMDNFKQLFPAAVGIKQSLIKEFFELSKVSTVSTAKFQAYSNTPRFVIEIAVMAGVGLIILQRSFGDPSSVTPGVVTIFVAGLFRIISALLPLQSAVTVMQESYIEAKLANGLHSELESISINQRGASKEISRNPVQVIATSLAISPESGGPALFEPINFNISAGSVALIRGPSGIGKSSLAEVIVGLRTASAGALTLDGFDPKVFVDRFPGRVAYVPQFCAVIPGSLRENVTMKIGDADFSNDLNITQILEKLGLDELLTDQFGLDGKIGGSTRILSGGQLQRLGLARAIFSEPDLLILDEPTSALDKQNTGRIMSYISSLRGECTIILISHQDHQTGFEDTKIHLQAAMGTD